MATAKEDDTNAVENNFGNAENVGDADIDVGSSSNGGSESDDGSRDAPARSANETRRRPRGDAIVRDAATEERSMRLALEVARSALAVGEVPVGCVIVRRGTDEIVSHGANMVNATRDATRHAEMVAIDRTLTGGVASDLSCLPADVGGRVRPHRRTARGDDDPPPRRNGDVGDRPSLPWNLYEHHDAEEDGTEERPRHLKLHDVDVFSQCDLYVTCEPCIMCAAALARVGIGRVFYGCKNDRFGGCGSLMRLHEQQGGAGDRGYPAFGGVLEHEAISLLRSFYDRENFHAPEDKRKKKFAKTTNEKKTRDSENEKDIDG